MSKPKISLVLENLRSIYNVGSILRTCDGFGVKNIVYIGTTPYPLIKNDSRLPFMAKKQTEQIHKTALGAEKTITGRYFKNTQDYLDSLEPGQLLVALEQTESSSELSKFKLVKDTHIVLGNEVTGVSEKMLASCSQHIEIPMQGKKESFNVEVSAAIALYQLTM